MILKRDSKRIKELEKINVQHRKLNGKLRQEIDILESQLDFITYQNIVIENLQKENNHKDKLIDIANAGITNLQQENEELKKNQRYYKNGVFSLEYDKETLSDMVDDYKSRVEKAVNNCEKSIESINKKLENNKEPFEVVDGKIIYLNDYQVCRLKAIRMKCKELLNILQNGSDSE